MISKFFIEHPVLANVLAIIIVLIGSVALYTLPVSEYPNVVPPTVQVTTRYPGASPQTVVDTVALPIELQVNGVDRMLYMQSTSAADGTYVLTITFDIGTDPNIDQVLVQNRVNSAMAQLPQAVQSQGVTIQKKNTSILQIVTLDSPDGRYDSLFMSNYATINLVNELARLPGVGNVTVFGASNYAMRIWLDPQKLYSYGLQPKDVILAVREQSQEVAAGQVGMPPAPKDQDFQYTIDIQSRLNDPAQFGEIIIKDMTAQGGQLVRVKDVARVDLGAQTYSQDFKLNAKPGAGIAIFQTPEANSIAVAKAVKAKMDKLSAHFPEGLRFTIPFDTTIFVEDSITEVYKTLYQAGILVLIVILVFLQNFRATLVPATTVPVTIIGAFAAMAALGFTVNLSTLFGIVLAIGIVVDDAIVIVEGVSKYIERGMSGHDAAITAMNELIGPILGITLVLMSVFIPAAFMPGLTGQMFAQFALVIAATALISAINAATLKPTQCAMWLREPTPPDQRNAFYRGFNFVYQKMENGYAALIGRMVRHAGLMVLISLALAGLGIWGIARLPTAFIPNDDQGYAMIAVQLPDGAALGRTTAALGLATEIAKATPGVEDVIAISGQSVLDNNATLANAGVEYVIFKSYADREKQKGQDLISILEHMQAKLNDLPDGRGFVLVPPPIPGIGQAGGFQMMVELRGGSQNYVQLDEVTQQIVKAATADPSLQRVLTTFHPSAPHVGVTVDRDRAQTLKVSVGDVFSTLSTFLGSSFINQFNKFGLTYQVYAQADSQFRLTPEDILNFYVRNKDLQMVPISSVAYLGHEVAPPLLTLYNLFPAATVVGSPARGFSSGQSMATMEKIATSTLPKDAGFEWSGMSYQEKLVGNQLVFVFGLSILLVYLVLAGQYESWILPLSVLSAVPLALLGPVIALTSLGVANNLYTQIGLMLLIALSAKNGILIVEVAREEHVKNGKSVIDAAVEAARVRFRPILMTSFAFILGVVPLVIATGAGANARRSLGISVFSGMIASTCLAVLFVPSFFTLLQGFEERRKQRKAKTPAAAPAT
ncbi:transporter, hydrophobe/amphiphile efflux-1 (HAE1) family [Methylocella silvestris BL2]|uniref:Efflux pump membrane transporter n=1 Tax=Methylocella silvestris (strain DSM 15510 / CIP 108128 / LMG 27833 / NCIMB 13906 / BL2) TaxID=395965 RepID=B8EN87_METSB|nr:efflux RND transporter permease subunit [Methylocella silvestris]ACK49600.1 transporter, hydrophobe/amphiphile efflux-1 (HAE1) family [Methylocella silvestris BL2]